MTPPAIVALSISKGRRTAGADAVQRSPGSRFVLRARPHRMGEVPHDDVAVRVLAPPAMSPSSRSLGAGEGNDGRALVALRREPERLGNRCTYGRKYTRRHHAARLAEPLLRDNRHLVPNGVRDGIEAVFFARFDADAERFDRKVQVKRTRDDDDVREVVFEEVAILNDDGGAVLPGRFLRQRIDAPIAFDNGACGERHPGTKSRAWLASTASAPTAATSS